MAATDQKAHAPGVLPLPAPPCWLQRSATLALLAVLFVTPGHAAQLADERTDVMFHGYDGGGVTIEGPSVLVRKNFREKFSVWGNYYADMISGASIDVVATASAYSETRQEGSAGVEYLHDKTVASLSFTGSREDDYEANTVSGGFSQSFFGDLTTLSMGYAYGWDTVKRNGDDTFEESLERRSYRIDVSQVLTKRALVNVGFETITDEGYLNNPYRSVRYADPGSGNGFAYQAERYPNTRTSNAVAVRGLYHLPWRAAARAEYRWFDDSWGISSNEVDAAYRHPFGDRWMVTLKARWYDQGPADFYADLFPFRDAQNFLARDKELSDFSSWSVGGAVQWTFRKSGFLFFDRASLSLAVDYVNFEYDNFRDVTAGGAAGDEPLYEFEAWVYRGYLSLWL